MSPRVMHEIKVAVQREADHRGVSASFVVSVILAHAFGIKKQERY